MTVGTEEASWVGLVSGRHFRTTIIPPAMALHPLSRHVIGTLSQAPPVSQGLKILGINSFGNG